MTAYDRLRDALPTGLARYVMFFEASIEDAVRAFAAETPKGALVVDAGAGEGNYRGFFKDHLYVGLDLGIGDMQWDYSRLDVVGDLSALPFRDAAFDGAINIVTLEHVKEPARVMEEIGRVLRPQGRLLVVVPHEWEVHQEPHDYFRYTRHGMRYLLERAGFSDIAIEPVGGYFRLLARRLLNGLQFFPGLWMPVAAIFFAPPALLLPLLDSLDKRRNFTLGYICTARKPS